MKQELQNEIFQVLRKYGLITIGYALWFRFVKEFVPGLINAMGLFNNNGSHDSDALISSIIAIIANLIVWSLMLTDCDNNNKLKWLLFGITLLNPWMGVTFIVIYKMANLSKE